MKYKAIYPLTDGGSREDRDWRPDCTNMKDGLPHGTMSTETIRKILEEQERESHRLRANFERTTPRETFADNHYNGFR